MKQCFRWPYCSHFACEELEPYVNVKTLPTLYKRTSTGVAFQRWDICTEDNVIVTRWGQIDGAIQETRDEIKKGKNAGRSNATTPDQQAQSEAQSRWEKKLQRGYVKTIDEARAGKVDEGTIKGGIFPMLAMKFSEHGDRLVYPCYMQPKLDGHRCIAIVDDLGEVTLWTRSRKPITSMEHICSAIESLGLESGTVLDGELYNHEYKDRFEELTSFIRDSEARPGSENVQYHVYDLPSEAGRPFSWRLDVLESLDLLGAEGHPDALVPIVPVTTKTAADEDELMLAFRYFLDLGYEGAMARNAAGLYLNKRSYDLLKIKEFDDAEFNVIGVNEGRGKLVGHAIFVCETADGAKFEAKLKGPLADLKQYFDDPTLAVGRRLTVQYQGITKKSKVPRFPVALRFRDD